MVKVIKNKDADSLKGELKPLDLTDIVLHAKSILENAKIKSRELITDAVAQSRTISADAYKQGYEKGYQDGMQKGTVDGRKSGNESAVQQVRKESAELIAVLRKLIDALEEKSRYQSENARKDLVELSFKIVEKILNRQIELDPDIVNANIIKAIELTAQKTDLEILMSPDDLVSAETFFPEIQKTFSEIKTIKLVQDTKFPKGSVVVKSRTGSVDASVAVQLDELYKIILKGNK
ncbi:MAG: hypothetical protein HZA48_04580 [Planctomycetes bacterium]|nr:hypothetical protein [Planctomycetota bacterium]